MSSSQAPDHSHPHGCEWSLLPLLLLSHETLFRGNPSKVAPSTMRSVISEAHPPGGPLLPLRGNSPCVPGNDGFSFDSCGYGRRNSARLSLTEGFSTACNHTFRCDYLYGCPGRFCMLRQSESTPRQYQLFSVQLKPARRIFCGLRAARIGVLLIRAVFRVRAFGGGQRHQAAQFAVPPCVAAGFIAVAVRDGLITSAPYPH